MRIAFLGLPIAALLLDADGHALVAAGLRTGLTAGRRRLARRIGPDRIALDPHQDWPSFEARVRREAPELLVSWFFTRRIPMGVVKACRLGGVGVHPSLLPRHRGPDPFFWAIDSGDTQTGVTAHRIDEDYDTGAILGRRLVAIEPGWNAWALARALDRPSLALLREVVQRAARGDRLAGEPQREADATQAPEPGEEARVLAWDWTADRVVRRVRALAPVPGALVGIGDQDLVLLRAEVAPAVPRALLPGEGALVDGRAVVRASDTGVALLEGLLSGRCVGPDDIAKLVALAGEK
jgi:methionyl-tRNA formyltransferase